MVNDLNVEQGYLFILSFKSLIYISLPLQKFNAKNSSGFIDFEFHFHSK